MIFSVIDDLNEDLPADQQLGRSSATVLFGNEGKLDSLGLVSLIVSLEQNVNDRLTKPVTLASEQAMARTDSPFRSVAALTDYIVELAKA